jgi:hypothetical protein
METRFREHLEATLTVSDTPSRRSAARSWSYRPIDLGSSGHPPLRLAPVRLRIGIAEVYG